MKCFIMIPSLVKLSLSDVEYCLFNDKIVLDNIFILRLNHLTHM